jgi:putative ABC transport system permease protein
VESVSSLSGVKAAEGLLEIPVELKHKHLKKDVVLTGLEQNSVLYKIHDYKRNTDLSPSGSGIILSDRLAEKLDAKRGDIIYVSSRLLKDDVPLMVSNVAEMNMGQICYMNIEGLAELFEINLSVTSVIFNAEDTGKIKSYLTTASNVISVQDRETIMAHNRTLMGPASAVMVVVEIMAIAVAFAIIYNISSISLSEKKREYTTLRVLGLTVKEVGEILKFENWLLCFIGMLLGIPCAKILITIYAGMTNFDLMKFPATISPYAYISGLIECIAVVFLSNKSSVQIIKKFDMVEVLKDRE